MNRHPRRVQRLLALGIATGTAVVAATASAAAAPGATAADSLYTGSADASAFQLVLTLPTALAVVPGTVLPNPLDLSLIRNTGQAAHDGKTADIATATSDLAQGSLVSSSALTPLLAPVLSKTVTAKLGQPNPPPFTALPVPTNPLGLALSVGTLNAATSTSQRSATSAGAVGTGALGSLASLGIPLATLTGPLSTVVTTLGGVVTTLTTTIQTLPLPAVPAQTIACPAPLAALCTTIGVTQVTTPALSVGGTLGTLAGVPAQINSLLANLGTAPLVSLSAIASDQSVVPAGSATVSKGSANVGDINILGGLITVVASKATATAAATGKPGTATADASATLVDVRVTNGTSELVKLILSEQGLTAGLLADPNLDATLKAAITPVNDALNAALTQLNTLLNTLSSGAKLIQQGTATHTVSSDGTKAEAHATPAMVSIGIPTLAPNLVALSLGKVDVVSERRNILASNVVAPPVVAPVAPKTPAKPVAPKSPEKKLAFTGADLPLTGGLAALLVVGGAALARRRRTREI